MKKQKVLTGGDSSLEETLFIFRRKLTDILRKEAENLNCPISHIDTLLYIAEQGNPSMKDIASYLKITPPSATAIIEMMQKKKLITRVTNEKDRRTIRVVLTTSAWKFFKSFHKIKFDIFTKMLSKLKEEDRKELVRILNILISE